MDRGDGSPPAPMKPLVSLVLALHCGRALTAHRHTALKITDPDRPTLAVLKFSLLASSIDTPDALALTTARIGTQTGVAKRVDALQFPQDFDPILPGKEDSEGEVGLKSVCTDSPAPDRKLDSQPGCFIGHAKR